MFPGALSSRVRRNVDCPKGRKLVCLTLFLYCVARNATPIAIGVDEGHCKESTEPTPCAEKRPDATPPCGVDALPPSLFEGGGIILKTDKFYSLSVSKG